MLRGRFIQEGDWGSAPCLVPGCHLHRYMRRGRQNLSPAAAHGAQAVALTVRLAETP